MPRSDTESTDNSGPSPVYWHSSVMAAFYELLVVHGTYWAWWGCRWPHVADLYRRNLTARHLEIGPGTGYVLRRVSLPSAESRLDLLDQNEGPLRVSARRLARYQPTCHIGNALDPFPLGERSVDSVAAGMVLHCVPGPGIPAKAAMFDHVARVLTPGGRFFGCTVVTGEDVPMSRFGRRGLRRLNATNMFDNLSDSRTDLERELHARFDDVSVRMRGAVALWEAGAK